MAEAGGVIAPGERPGEGPKERQGEGPLLRVAGFAGPLDLLLELVRRHRLDLGQLSFAALTEQFLAAVESGAGAGAGQVPLERRSEWLVMASQLVLLKARLLCPETPASAAAAEAEAARRLDQLAELTRMRAAAAWLGARPQLGTQVFGQGRTTPQARPQAEFYVAFLEATLAMLEGRAGATACPLPPLGLPPLGLWRVTEALARIAALLRERPEGLPLTQCLPPIPPGAPPIRLRAALASTLLASLELARENGLELAQEMAFGPIRLKPPAPGAARQGR